MPAQVDDSQSADIRVAVAPLMEIESAICGALGPAGRRKDEGLAGLIDQESPTLAQRLREFWNDDHTEWAELFVILERAGLTLSPDPDAALDALPELAAEPYKVPPLPSEDSGTREAVQARIDRLAASSKAREQYRGLLKEIWAVGKSQWREEAQGAAEELGRRIALRVQAGDSLQQILPQKHLALNDAYRTLIDGSQPVVITPLALSPQLKYILQVKGRPVYVGFGETASESRLELRRQRLEEAAVAFKVLSDPTRLAILEYFLSVPASVSDLARVLDVSQPTISAHVKILREAGLLTSSRKGSHTLYRADRTALQGLIERGTTTLGA